MIDSTPIYIQLFKVVIFMIFVSAIIEVIKGFSAVGLVGLMKQIFKALFSNNNKLTTDSIRVLNFLIAMLCCYAFDFGIMANIVQVGAKVREGLAGWIDYFGTASLVYMGADWVYAQFSSAINKAKETGTTIIKESSASKESTTITK